MSHPPRARVRARERPESLRQVMYAEKLGPKLEKFSLGRALRYIPPIGTIGWIRPSSEFFVIEFSQKNTFD